MVDEQPADVAFSIEGLHDITVSVEEWDAAELHMDVLNARNLTYNDQFIWTRLVWLYQNGDRSRSLYDRIMAIKEL